MVIKEVYWNLETRTRPVVFARRRDTLLKVQNLNCKEMNYKVTSYWFGHDDKVFNHWLATLNVCPSFAHIYITLKGNY